MTADEARKLSDEKDIKYAKEHEEEVNNILKDIYLTIEHKIRSSSDCTREINYNILRSFYAVIVKDLESNGFNINTAANSFVYIYTEISW